MENAEWENIWKSYDQKMESMLAVNKAVAIDLTRQKLNRQISRLYAPKWFAVVIGVPYILLMGGIAIVTFIAQAYIISLGFGAIALIMAALLIHYFHQLHLISQVRNNEDVLTTQQQLSELKLSSFNSLNLAVFQLPFWSLCWVSIDALIANPFVYGGINLLVFLLLAYSAYWLYHKINYVNQDSKVRDFFLSGREWEPIVKSAEILDQIREYEA